MSIFFKKDPRVVCQGITGQHGSFHTESCIAYGTKILCGVTPGRGGETHVDLPVYNTVEEAVTHHGCNASMIFVPPVGAADAIMEAATAGIELIVCITEGIPILDMLKVTNALKEKKVRLIGPNCPGIIVPDRFKIGIMPGNIHKSGGVGVVSRSGTLTYEAVYQLTKLGVGQSCCVGIGGDPIIGTSFVDVVSAFIEDPQTKGFIIIGEIGGSEEEMLAEFLHKVPHKKPMVGFVAGHSAPKEKRMGHAGAIISGTRGTADYKTKVLHEAGVVMVKTPALIGQRMLELLNS